MGSDARCRLDDFVVGVAAEGASLSVAQLQQFTVGKCLSEYGNALNGFNAVRPGYLRETFRCDEVADEHSGLVVKKSID